jgi:hypothetical protein
MRLAGATYHSLSGTITPRERRSCPNRELRSPRGWRASAPQQQGIESARAIGAARRRCKLTAPPRPLSHFQTPTALENDVQAHAESYQTYVVRILWGELFLDSQID